MFLEAVCSHARGTLNGKAFKAQSVENLLERLAVAVAAPKPDLNNSRLKAKGVLPAAASALLRPSKNILLGAAG
jgi:hypothetical protein